MEIYGQILIKTDYKTLYNHLKAIKNNQKGFKTLISLIKKLSSDPDFKIEEIITNKQYTIIYNYLVNIRLSNNYQHDNFITVIGKIS